MSDIHFHREAYGWDANRDQRVELVRDLESQVAAGGPVDAVLVGGDIAFSGHQDEYKTAEEWLNRLVGVCGGIGMDRVWTVPGNHDVDRDILKTCMPAQVFREQIRSLPGATAVDEYLRERLTVDPAADSFFAPLGAYNEFAGRYMCHSRPARPHWLDDRTLSLDGRPVHLTGLNSSMNSDTHDFDYRDADGNRHLVLGALQCQLSREHNPIHIVLAHHPPEWIRDWAIVEPYLRRGHLWIFGHEHTYGSAQPIEGGSVRLSGGAVGPERDAGGEREPYVPAYLLLTLSLDADSDLHVHVQPRYWSMVETRFVEHPDGPQDFLVRCTPEVAGAVPGGCPAPAEPPVIAPASASPIADASAPPTGPGQPPQTGINLRELARLFGALPRTTRITIGANLGVLEETDLGLGAQKDLDRLILSRVGERGLVEQLQAKVTT